MSGPDNVNRKYEVFLSPEIRHRLECVARNGSAPAKKILHARILLMSDQHREGGAYHDDQIAAAMGTHVNTVARIRRLFALHGVEPALDRKPRQSPPVPGKLTAEAEAALLRIASSPPPGGRARWSLAQLRREVIDRRIVASISCETIRKAMRRGRNPVAGSAVPDAPPSHTMPTKLE